MPKFERGYYSFIPNEKQNKLLSEWVDRLNTPEKSRCISPGFHPVNKPEHYNRKGIEAIQAIEAALSAEEFKGYLSGNVIKYIWRKDYKGKPKEDCEKAKWYLERLIKLYD